MIPFLAIKNPRKVNIKRVLDLTILLKLYVGLLIVSFSNFSANYIIFFIEAKLIKWRQNFLVLVYIAIGILVLRS